MLLSGRGVLVGSYKAGTTFGNEGCVQVTMESRVSGTGLVSSLGRLV